MENETEAPFKIPQSSFGPIRTLVEMAEADFQAFIDGLKSAKPSISTSSLSKHIASVSPQVSSGIIDSVVDLVMTLEYVKQQSELGVEEFVSGIAESVLLVDSKNFSVSIEESDTLKGRLTKIFCSDHIIELNAKIASVVTDHDKVFLNASIMTDIRPVFNDDASALEAMAVLHTLRIHVGHNSRHEDFFAAMDSNDLRELKGVIERAEKKAEILKGSLKLGETPFIELENADS